MPEDAPHSEEDITAAQQGSDPAAADTPQPADENAAPSDVQPDAPPTQPPQDDGQQAADSQPPGDADATPAEPQDPQSPQQAPQVTGQRSLPEAALRSVSQCQVIPAITGLGGYGGPSAKTHPGRV